MYGKLFDLKDISNEMREYFEEVETVCGAPYERSTAPTIPRDLPATVSVKRKGIDLTPEDSARVLWAEQHGADYRITIEGEKHHNNWTQQTTPNGRQGHFEKKGYTIFFWGGQSGTVGFAPTCTCGGGTAHGIVLDPFFGSGTVGVVAKHLNRHYIGIEINPDYAKLAEKRINMPIQQQKAEESGFDWNPKF